MPNSKIDRIVRNIEYIQPKGALSDYKYGVKVKRTVATPQGLESENVFEPSISELSKELHESPLKRTSLPEPELLDKDGN